MSAWITPALAAVFWAGLLLQPRIGELVDPWVWLSAGGDCSVLRWRSRPVAPRR